MKNLPDHHTAHRIAALRAMQGLPFRIPPGYTVYRQSDFENSKLFRYIFIFGFVVGLAALFEPDPTSPPATPAAEQPAPAPVHATV
jgi:hypothetical protein